MADSPRTIPLPPRRAWYVEGMPPEGKLTHLLIEELERLMGIRNACESAVIRAFLRRFHALKADGDVMAAELSIGKGRNNAAVVYAHSPGAGVIAWVPSLVIPMSARLDRIMRECGLGKLFAYRAEPARDVWGRVEPKGSPRTETIKIQLSPAKRRA
jgi:hypothetical protein